MTIEEHERQILVLFFKEQSTKWLKDNSETLIITGKHDKSGPMASSFNECITKLWKVNNELNKLQNNLEYKEFADDLFSFAKKCSVVSFKFIIEETASKIYDILQLKVPVDESGYDTEPCSSSQSPS